MSRLNSSFKSVFVMIALLISLLAACVSAATLVNAVNYGSWDISVSPLPTVQALELVVDANPDGSVVGVMVKVDDITCQQIDNRKSICTIPLFILDDQHFPPTATAVIGSGRK